MKKLILIAASAFIASMTSAQTTAYSYTQERKQNLKDEQSERHSLAQLDRSVDFNEYIKGAQEEVAGNDKRITALKAKVASEKQQGDRRSEKAIKKMEKTIEILEKYNNELKADLNNYIKYGTGDWTLFKMEFNQDLTELGSELNDLRHDYTDFMAENLR